MDSNKERDEDDHPRQLHILSIGRPKSPIYQTRQNSCIQCGGIYSVQLSRSGGHSVSGGSPCHMLSGGRTSLCLRLTAHPGEGYRAYSWEHSPIRAQGNAV